VLAPTARVAAPKLLLIVGGLNTVTLAVAVFPVPSLVEVTVTELFFTPAVVAVTLTTKVQGGPAPTIVSPAKLTEDAPAVAVMVPEHVAVITLGVETTNPAGKVSVNATPVSIPVTSGLVTVNVRLVLPPTAIAAAPKLLVILGGNCPEAGSRNKPADDATKVLRRMV